MMAPNAAAALPNSLGTPSPSAESTEQQGSILPPAAADQHSAFWITFATYFPQAARFAEGAYFSMIVKGMCMAGNILVQISPYATVKRWETMGCTGEADAAPYVSIAFGGWQWCFYGLFAWALTKRSGFLILVQSNFLGAILGSYYTVTFYRNCRNAQFLDSFQRYMSAAVTLALLQVCALLVLPSQRSLFLVGCLSSFCGFAAAGAMMTTVPMVFRNKDSSSIPGPFVIASLLSSLVWCMCGWILDDPLVVGPNMFSVFTSLFTLYLKWKYPSGANVKDQKAVAGDTSVLQAALAFARDVVKQGRVLPPSSGMSSRRRPSRSQRRPSKEWADAPSDTDERTPLITSYEDENQQAAADAPPVESQAVSAEPPITASSDDSTNSQQIETAAAAVQSSSPASLSPPRRVGTCADGTGGTF